MIVLNRLGLCLWLLLRNPLALALVSLVVAVMHGALRGMGLPRLFWSHRPLHRFLAGFATSLLALQVILTTFAVAGDAWTAAGAGGLAAFAAWAGGLWTLAIISAVVLRLWHNRGAAAGAPASMRPRVGRLSPSIWAVGPRGPTVPIVRGVRVFEFLAGVALGGAVAAALILFAEPVLAALPAVATAGPRLAPLLCAVGVIAIMALGVLGFPSHSTPAVAICFFGGTMVAAVAVLAVVTRNGGAATLVVLMVLLAGGVPRYKLRIRELAAFYGKPVKYPPLHRAAPSRPLLPFDAPCDVLGTTGPAPLVIVCTSGGGLRAAAWTAGVLERLDRSPEFRAAVRLVTGASGGMLGAGCWVANRLRATRPSPNVGPPKGPPALLYAVGGLDSLAAVARGLVYHDVPLAFLPFRNSSDRGRRMAESWEGRMRRRGLELDVAVGDLREPERSGMLPFLVFSPMIVEDGRRLLLSNLDLSEITDQKVRWLSSSKSPHQPTTALASQTGYHVAQLMPDDWHRIRLSTAMRLSAAFPYVSPAVLLPTRPRRRVVDAGYFDNYGLELACSWLRHLLVERKAPWIQQRISAILILQIRDNVSTLSVNPQSFRDLRRIRQESSSPLPRGLEGLTSPPEGLLAARESVALFRNDALVRVVSDLYAGTFGQDFVTTTVFEFAGEASLSWELAPDEVRSIALQARSPGIRGKEVAILEWLARHAPPVVMRRTTAGPA